MRKLILSAVSAAALTAGMALSSVAGASPASPAITSAPPGITGPLPAVSTARQGALAAMPQPGKAASADAAPPNMAYHGGPVQSNVHLYVIFWGTWWQYKPSPGCPASQGNGGTAENLLHRYYNGVGSVTDGLSNVQTQYRDSAGHRPRYPVSQGHVFANWLVYCADPPASASQGQLASLAAFYANWLRTNEGATNNSSTQIVVVSPPGTDPGGVFASGDCAYHSWTPYGTGLLSWTNLAYLSGTLPDGISCGAGLVSGPLDGWSIVAGHEYAESATDPQGTGWFDNQHGLAGEIGDKCAWRGLFTQALPTGRFPQQPEWSNAAHGCRASDLVKIRPVPATSTRVHHAVSFKMSVTAPYRVTFSASGLPKGTRISSAGKITGSPTATGTYHVTVYGHESASAVTGHVRFTWKVVP